MGILDFFALPGQERTRLRDEYLGGLLNYYLGPTGIPERLGLVDMLNPVADVGRAMTSSQEMLAPGRTPMERVGAGATMLADMASVAAPAAATRIAGGDAAQAMTEGLLGAPMAVEEAGRRVVERLNQPGPVPTMYSNPLGRGAKKEVLGAGAGQMDVRLTIPGVGGRIDYSVFEGRPRINMIEVPEGARRKGNATKLLQALQDEFPNMEIDWGMLTEDGSRLYGATKFRDVPSEFADDFARLEEARANLAKKQSEFADMEARGVKPPSGFFAEWNELSDNVDDLERALSLESPTKRLIASTLSADPAIERGQEVLQMLRSGRASEITDDMLDMGDPVLNARLNMYLYDNYDLPMDEASRAARAGEMGFDTAAYHGTTQDFPAFDPKFRGSATDAGWYGPGEYTTPTASSAEAYYQGNWPEYDAGGNTIPVRVRAAEPIANNYGNVTEYVARDPRNIRSRFARFDPRLAHLRNLSAGVGGLGLLATQMPEQQRDEEIRQYLGGLL